MIGRFSRAREESNPLGGPVALAGWIGLIVVALGLALVARGGVWLDPPRAFLDDLIAPGRAVASAPFAAARDFTAGLGGHWRVHKQNERLRRENRELKEWYELAQTLMNKTARYEELLALNPEPAAQAVTARVVADAAGPFVRARLVNVGAEDGVAPGQAVVSERGLVGRVVASGRQASRVLLLTDLNSRIPVLVERTDDRAILAGDNAERPRLDFLPAGHGLVSGDRIVTSGDGGQFPRGLIVGEARAASGGTWRVRLFADDAPVDYVRILRYSFPPAPEDEPAVAPPAPADSQPDDGAATVASAAGGPG
ncbi:MAG: rod shape-determining protein MreC [Caulobacterales bacterium]|nr:rod shape-determining protein MreC [Caulobacterales bacterium]